VGRPSKFTEARRQRILAVLSAGGSRRTAASVSGIAPATLTGWLTRGERVPEGRYGKFRREVLDAESGTHRLVGLPAEDPSELRWAVRFLERAGGEFAKHSGAVDDDSPLIKLTWPGRED
jgi:hypothetical protein